jgi:hypothetical protein
MFASLLLTSMPLTLGLDLIRALLLEFFCSEVADHVEARCLKALDSRDLDLVFVLKFVLLSDVMMIDSLGWNMLP